MNILATILSQPALLLEPNYFNAYSFLNGNGLSERPIAKPARASLDPTQEDDAELPPRHQRILELRTDITGVPTTAIIRVDGLIVKHVDEIAAEIFGLVDLDDVDAAIAQVRNDQQIQNVLFTYNTPGGCIIGMPETADLIYQLAREKNVKAFSDSMCCSGGIFLATQASEFFVTASAHTGSIGAIRPPILDVSKALAMQGVTPTIIKHGKYKDTGTSLRPVTDDEIQYLQNYVDRVMSMFTDAVMRNRRISRDNMEGQVFFGREAVDVGLADAVLPDLAAALAQF